MFNKNEDLKKRIKNLDKELFFILSTARCRSSWFSNLFTYKVSFCYKEQTRYITNWNGFIDHIEKRPEKYIGFADPELLHFVESLYDLFPEAKYVLLERDRHESEQSLLADTLHNIGVQIPPNIVKHKFDRWDKDIKKFKEIIKHYEHIHFNDMGNPKNIQKIWNYILPGYLFDTERWELLSSLKIAVTMMNVPFIVNSATCMAPYFDFKKLELAK
tara:strand:- start:27 stop:674 length:648 start_codon:yes stop_codon:yes gene_type:complete